MVHWLSKVVYLIVGLTASIVCIGVGVYMIVDPTHDRETLSRSAGVMGILIGLFWLRMTWKGRQDNEVHAPRVRSSSAHRFHSENEHKVPAEWFNCCRNAQCTVNDSSDHVKTLRMVRAPSTKHLG